MAKIMHADIATTTKNNGGREERQRGICKGGGQGERTAEGEKHPPLSEAVGNKSSHLSSAGGESAVQTSRQLLLSLLSVPPLLSLILSSVPQTEESRRSSRGRKPKI